MRLSGLAAFQPLVADRQSAQKRVSESLRRLSSGMRIPTAQSDAAGAAVAVNLETKAISQRAANRNIDTAIGLVQIAESELTTQVDLLQRGKELAVAAASDTVSQEGRTALDTEYQSLLQEVTRSVEAGTVAGLTSASGSSGSSSSSTKVSIGLVIDTTGSMNFLLNQVKAEFSGFVDSVTADSVETGLVEFNVSSDSVDGTRLRQQMSTSSIDSALSSLSTQGGLVDPWTALTEAAGITSITGTQEDDELTPAANSDQKILILVTDTFREVVKGNNTKTQSDIADELAAEGWEVHVIGRSFYSSYYDGITTGTGGAFYNSGDGVDTALASIASSVNSALDSSSTSTSTTGVVVQVGTESTESSRFDTQLPFETDSTTLGLAGSSLLSRASSLSAMDAVDSGLITLQRKLAILGAVTNRLTHQRSIGESIVYTATRSQSALEDTDMALESARLTAGRIQSNAASAAMSQARKIARKQVGILLA